LGDIWRGLVRLDPIDMPAGRVEVAYEFGTRPGGRAQRFLPAWALHLLPLPEGAAALLVISRSLTLTIFHASRLRCTFAYELPRTDLTALDVAFSLHRHLSVGGSLDDVFVRYRDIVVGIERRS
jgi:hypothetical protein